MRIAFVRSSIGITIITAITSGIGIAALAVTACSSSTFSASNPFVGTWSCTGTETSTFTQPAGAPDKTNNTAQTLTVVDNGDGTITGTGVNDAGATCALKSSVSGSTSTLLPNQTCTSNGITTTHTGGSGTVSGNTLSRNGTWTFAGTSTVVLDGGATKEVQVAGSATGSSTCTKQ